VRLRPLSILAVATVALAFAARAVACACCGNAGDWSERTGKLEAFQVKELERVRFGPAREVPSPAGGVLPNRAFPVTATLIGKLWKLALAGAGTVTLRLPATATSFAVDLRDGKTGGGGGPLLYTELRLRGSMTATGSLHGTRYRLILMGRGSNCLNADALRHFRLELRGGATPVALYGDLRRPTP
jgi:hypothetical protein